MIRIDDAAARAALGVGPLAGRSEVRRAFLARAQLAHPDRPGGSEDRYRRLVAAFQRLAGASLQSAARERLQAFRRAWAA